MRTPRRAALAAACALLPVAHVCAAVLEVPGAYPTIQAAVDASASGDVPARAGTAVRLDVRLDAAAAVRLDVFDVTGRQVAVVPAKVLDAGTHALRWTPATGDVGVRFLRVATDEWTETAKIQLLP